MPNHEYLAWFVLPCSASLPFDVDPRSRNLPCALRSVLDDQPLEELAEFLIVRIDRLVTQNEQSWG